MLQDPILINDWHPIAPVSALAEGAVMSARLLGQDLVLWRLNGQVMAWQDLCLHRGTRLSLGWVSGERLVCPYHGWEYNSAGRCALMPAHPNQTPSTKAKVCTYRTCEAYDLIWVSLGDPQQGVPAFPEWEQPTYRKLLAGPYQVNASGPRLIENFLDVAHFPFVHEGTLGARSHPEIADYEAEIGPEGVVARNVRIYQPDPYGTGQGDTVAYTYKALRPLTAYLFKDSETRGLAILLMVTPHEVLKSTAWMWIAMNYGHEIPAEELIAWQDGIFAQDRPIVESQRPELLPLDLQAELHLRSDRTAIAYRKWLNQLGLTFGTA
jgi:phenylpropionate dioxygenase-like ring-hydroxylating dioxygenase large terminal subunit